MTTVDRIELESDLLIAGLRLKAAVERIKKLERAAKALVSTYRSEEPTIAGLHPFIDELGRVVEEGS